ncbi:FeoA family protein [Gorillibacterium timonense]|uniref:FeoA family protein n=1 Tax=Gorillibacterium timonense TaxID=1689269 RepID=UPI000A685E4D|nr:FeoA family protein [Gorillibacterium timonense]
MYLSAEATKLSSAITGQRFRITGMSVEGVLRRRLLDLGFVPGAIVEVLQKSPLGDPVAYRVRMMTVALRREESDRIYGTVEEGGEA